MRSFSTSGGWLAFIGSLGTSEYAVTGDAYCTEICGEAGPYAGARVRVTCELAPGGLLIDGQAAGQGRDELLWEVLRRWPQPGPDGREWPPELAAMIELASRHPEEYRELCGNRAVLLRVVPDRWMPPPG